MARRLEDVRQDERDARPGMDSRRGFGEHRGMDFGRWHSVGLMLALSQSIAGCECSFGILRADAGGSTGLDAPGLDAPGLDAPGLDAPGLDAPGLDAVRSDVPPGADTGWDAGPAVGDCVPGLLPNGLVRICVPFPSGARQHDVAPVEDSFGTRPPPEGTSFRDNEYRPRAGECSTATHDRYWVRWRDGVVYRTWHPPSTVDVETGMPCNFGHEHGNDPRTSPLYLWAGGIPFSAANRAAELGATHYHRHEDHFGHKVVVQNDYEAAVGNGPGPDTDPYGAAGFRCHWLSKIHQGTHSGDALGHNEHEYFNNVMCDDGAVRRPDDPSAMGVGPTNHTETSVLTLTVWGSPGWFKGCDGLERTEAGSGHGREPPPGSDTNREIKCANMGGWSYKELPREVTSRTGHPDFEPRDAGIDELWKPWATVVTRDGQTIFTSSAYYVVRNPARLWNDGALVPRRDVDGDGAVDTWIPTLEACLAMPMRFGQCRDLPTFPSDVPMTEWWRHPLSPFNGTIRVIHPKRIDLFNQTGRTWFCTDYRGVELADPNFDARGVPSCPNGQLPQRLAATRNLWFGQAAWASGRRGSIDGTMVNARGDTQNPGYGHEWVRFFNAPGIHAPN